MDTSTAVTGSFEDWYSSEFSRVLTAVTMICGNPEVAEDATQDAFIRAFDQWDSVSKMRSPVGWTAKVAHNLIRRSFRRRRALAMNPASLPETMASDPTIDVDRQIDTWNAIQMLSSRQRRAVVLRYIDDLTQAEIADHMQISPGTAAATLHHARSHPSQNDHLTASEDKPA